MAGGTGQSQTPMGGGSSPLNTGGGMSGGQTQVPNFAAPQQQPEMMMSDMRYRPEPQYQPQGLPRFGNQFAQAINQLTQNPFQPQQPSFMQDPEFQGYQTQAQDLQRQMDEYMRKAPMYQQLQELQGKMAPFQQRHQQQQMQQAQLQRYQQPSPFRRGQFQQPAGIQGLMGMLGGRGGMQQPSMSMDMPYARGFASALPTYFMKKGGKV